MCFLDTFVRTHFKINFLFTNVFQIHKSIDEFIEIVKNIFSTCFLSRTFVKITRAQNYTNYGNGKINFFQRAVSTVPCVQEWWIIGTSRLLMGLWRPLDAQKNVTTINVLCGLLADRPAGAIPPHNLAEVFPCF